MMKTLTRLLREPLVHFILLGAALFALFHLRGGSGSGATAPIVVGTGEVERLALSFTRLWQRPPSAEELRGLIDNEIREEVYYREALAMGLDRGDEIVRRRLQQKLEFLSADIAAQQKPTDAELEAFLKNHPEKFRTEPKVAFRQVYVSRERRGGAAEGDARLLLAKLRAAGPKAHVAQAGDSISLPSENSLQSQSDVARTFGTDFAARIAALPAGLWEGPIESGYGLHLVLVTESVPGNLPTLAQARDAVEREWNVQRRTDYNASFFSSLRSKYFVTVELPAWAKDAAPAADRVRVEVKAGVK